jgi:Fic family protein
VEEVQDVLRCLEASEHAMNLLHGGLPLSVRFIKEIHEVLVHAPRQASTFRRAPVWLGGTSPGNAVFVPPPWNEVARCMMELENCLDDPSMPTLIKAGLVHAQFETIHPFLEANGRLGRILITVMLIREKALSEPWLSLSLYFRQHRQQYVDLLMGTRETGDWEAWLEFFLHAIEVTAEYAHFTARKAVTLFAEHEALLSRVKGPQKKSVLAVYRQLQQRPMSDAKSLSVSAGVKPPATLKALERLEKLGIVSAVSPRVFSYAPLVDLLQKDLPL